MIRVILTVATFMNARVFLCTTLLLLFHPQFHGQAVTNELPSAPDPAGVNANAPSATEMQDATQDAIQAHSTAIPEATLVEQPPPGEVVRMEADHQSKDKNVVRLTGNVVVRYLDYVIRSQELVYDENSGEVSSPGQLFIDGGPDQEHVSAARGTMNLQEQTGHFYQAVGTITPPPPRGTRVALQSVSPFLFTGREVVKLGPARYTIYNGVVTSCELPHPDWAFHSTRTEVDDQTARLYQSIFKLVDVPVFYFPYATHSLNADGRQSGLLIPMVGTSSSKGLIFGDEYYWVINRSMDAWVGLEYYSLRGFSQLGQFRYKGRDLDFAQFHFSALQDRGQPGTGVNQGGEDFIFRGRHDFTENTRAVGNIEYLSSYIYREAFAESFALAVASEVKSTAFVTHQDNGYAATAEIDRYQNFENTTPGDEVKILHLPSLELLALDHGLGEHGRVGDDGLAWSGWLDIAGLKRSEPGFSTSGATERVDIYPHLSWTTHLDGWTFRPQIAFRDTFYSRSGTPGHNDVALGDLVPTELNASLNRKDGEALIDILPPALEREFVTKNGWQWRHVIEPEAQYRFVGGVNNFQNVLRFDDTDIVSDTNEFEYGVTQRLYIKHRKMAACKPGELPAKGETKCPLQAQEAISWFVGQKYFLDPSFGGAVTPGIRNVLESTIDFSGVAYLTGNRDESPVVSRLRWRSTEKMDVEWDVDYDTRRGALLSSNTFTDFHKGVWTAGAGFSHLIEPDENFVAPIGDGHRETFDQVRWSVGYGGPTKRGFSLATTGGYDIDENAVQYGVVQTGYNWNCCGFSAEYRRFALGSVRNENQYRFNLTLAGVGTAGNLKKAERLY
jgi:LPS-assembly protein